MRFDLSESREVKRKQSESLIAGELSDDCQTKPASGLRADDGAVKSPMRPRSDVLQGSDPPSPKDERGGSVLPQSLRHWARICYA